MTELHVEHFTDPACPFAFSAEPVRQRLKWHYGDQLVWHDRMIVLTANDPEEAERLASGAPGLQRRYGMPIDPSPRRRASSSEPACRAVIAARLYAPQAAEPLLRRLRVRTMAGGLLDDPELIRAGVAESGLSPEQMDAWILRDDVERELAADMQAARAPSAAIRSTLRHKLSGRNDRRSRRGRRRRLVLGGRPSGVTAAYRCVEGGAGRRCRVAGSPESTFLTGTRCLPPARRTLPGVPAGVDQSFEERQTVA
jgi:predicted DsbA family dithiol-disulfide isomerase